MISKELKEFFQPEDVIYTYTSTQAVDDGILFDVDQFQHTWLNCPLKYVTSNLMSLGYWNTDKTLNIPNFRDLLHQALQIFGKMPKDDYFVSGRIELPSGGKQKVFIAQNETGRFTVMLPEDY